MLDDYLAYLSGNLVSAPKGKTFTYTIENDLPIPLRVYVVGEDGELKFKGNTIIGQSDNYPDGQKGMYLVFTSYVSSAFAGLVKLDPNNTHITITTDFLVQPNDIGPPPSPYGDSIIPQDSQSILVGVGLNEDGLVVAREQSWQKNDSSYSLAPNEKKTILISTTTGMTETSSSTDELETDVSMNISGGWGPVSASISASLSASTSTTQSISLEESNTNNIFQTLEGKEDSTTVIFIWQLHERIMWVDPGDTNTFPGSPPEIKACITSKLLPVVPVETIIKGKKLVHV